MKLSEFDNSDFDRGRPAWVEACWRVLEGLLFDSWLPGSGWRVWLLRRFGATVGEGVVIKPHVRVKFPWKLRIGEHSWIGESVWIDNLAEVVIGSDCCLSQGAYLCTGSHRWDEESFALEVKTVSLRDKVWLGAMVRVAPGVTVHEGAVLTLGSVVVTDIPAWQVAAGNPAQPIKRRTVNG